MAFSWLINRGDPNHLLSGMILQVLYWDHFITLKVEGPILQEVFKLPKYFLGSRWWFQIFLECSPLLGEMIQFEQHIFQMGGSTTNQRLCLKPSKGFVLGILA